MVDAESDLSKDPKVATHTNNRNFAQKLLKNQFVPKIIQGAISPIDQLVTKDVPVIRETLRALQMVLSKKIITDVAHSGARILWTPREVSRTGRDSSTPRGVNTAVAIARLTLQSPDFIGTSDSPTRTRNQDIFSPKLSIIVQKGRNAELLNAPINQFLAVHRHPTPIFRKIIGPKTVSGESADVYARKRMDFASNYFVAEIPNYKDLGLSPANTTDKLKSVIGPTTRVEGLTNRSDWLVSRHGCEEE